MNYFFESGEIDFVIGVARFVFGFLIAVCFSLLFQKNFNKRTAIIGITFGLLNDPFQGFIYDYYMHINNNTQIGMIVMMTLSTSALLVKILFKKHRTLSRIMIGTASMMVLVAWLVIHYSMVYVKLFDQRDGSYVHMTASMAPMIASNNIEAFKYYCETTKFDCIVRQGNEAVFKTDNFDSAPRFYDETYNINLLYQGTVKVLNEEVNVLQHAQTLTKEGAFVWVAVMMKDDGVVTIYEAYDRSIFGKGYSTSRILVYFWLTGVMFIWVGGALFLIRFHNKRLRYKKKN